LRGKETVLIDAGIGETRIRELDREMRIDILLITHSHPDHIRHGFMLEDRHILMPQQTPDSVSDLFSLGERFMGNKEDGEVWARFVRETFGVRPLRLPDGRFSEGDVLSMGDCKLEPIHAPGHLEDHYCFLEQNSGTLITTDIDLTYFGPWCGNPESDVEVFRKSVQRVMNIPHRRVCSSHKEPVDGAAQELFENFLAAFDRQKKMICDLCDSPITLDDLAKLSPFYHDTLKNKRVQFLFERQMAQKHIQVLIREGRVGQSDDLFSKIL
jgi:glyoxylase-like metal-dependent hydrolase (beta-lactamase superfamily II)